MLADAETEFEGDHRDLPVVAGLVSRSQRRPDPAVLRWHKMDRPVSTVEYADGRLYAAPASAAATEVSCGRRVIATVPRHVWAGALLHRRHWDGRSATNPRPDRTLLHAVLLHRHGDPDTALDLDMHRRNHDVCWCRHRLLWTQAAVIQRSQS